MMNLILLLIFSIFSIFFIEISIHKNKAFKIHLLIIFLYTFYGYPLPQKIAIVVILYWFFKIAFGKSTIRLFTPETKRFFILGFIIIALDFINAINNPKFIQDINFYCFAFIWPILIISTIKKLDHLKYFVKSFVICKFIELCIGGLVVYFFFYEEAQILISYLKEISGIKIEISDLELSGYYNVNDSSKRLYSIFNTNAADSSFFLFITFCLSYSLYVLDKSKIKLIFVTTIAVSILLTLTRTAIILSLVYFLFYNKSIFGNKNFVSSVIFSIIFLIFAYICFGDLIKSDDRLKNNQSQQARIEQYTSYITGIADLDLFSGSGDNFETLSNKLKLKNEISSESYFIKNFYTKGILVGFCIIGFFIDSIRIILYKKSKLKKSLRIEPKIWLSALLILHFSIIVFASTTLLVNNTFLYINTGLLLALQNIIIPKKNNLSSEK